MSENPLDKFDRELLEQFSDSSEMTTESPTEREYQRLLAECLTLRQNLESQTSELKTQTSELETLRLENQRLSSELDGFKRESWLILILSTGSSIALAFGINLVTGDSDQKWGLFLILLGVAFIMIVWFLKKK